MDLKTIKASIQCPSVNAYTFPEGPKGRGIKKIIHEKNRLEIVFDDGTNQFITLLNWWFGTKDEYNMLTSEEKKSREFYFIEEGS